MQQARNGSTVVMNYRYNGRGERTRAYLGSANTYTLCDEAGHWLGDYGNNGTVIQQAIWMEDLPVGVVTTAKTHYLQPDHLGTPRAVIDPASNKAVWSWSIRGEAFGATAPNEDPDQDGQAFVFNLRFPGQRYDAASGLNYNYFRDYKPGTGRYVQSDPAGLKGGISTYGYVRSGPMALSDTFGLQTDRVADMKTCGGGLGVTVCDGRGGIEIANCNYTCGRECTQKHEEEHSRFLKELHPSACAGRPRGAAPWPLGYDYDSYLRESQRTECRADAITIECLSGFRASGKSNSDTEQQLKDALNRRRRNLCDQWGY